MSKFIILIALPSVYGYATSNPTSTRPAFLTPSIPTRSPSGETSPRLQKYDLGLGKNAPLTSEFQAEVQTHDVRIASKYWMANEPAVTFPSPQSQHQFPTPSTEQQREPRELKRKRNAIPLIPKRQSQDVLQISNDRVMSRSQAAKLDVNTIWVEMLIHNQRMQLAHASQLSL